MVVCPHCNATLDKDEIVIERTKRGLKKQWHWVYSCPKCQKILGLSQESMM
jgi:uncharacterized protein with PIN domain